MPNIKLNPKSLYAEAFRSIKTNIKYSSVDKDKKIILITSSEPGEGKSTTAVNLAITLSQDNKTVLIMDCDLRKPTIHKQFKISASGGLTDLLISEVSLTDAIYSKDKYLDVLAAGTIPPNPAELLASDEMQGFLSELKRIYDYVVIDTTPLGVVADSQILTSKVDGVILVVKHGKTKKDKLVNCKKIIDQVGGKLIGVVINRVKDKNENYNYYY